MVLIDALTYPGVVISCRLLGALHVEERGLRGRPNHRLVAVPVKAARKDELRNFSDLGRRMQQELERFFVMSSAFTSKDPVVRGWVGPDAAFEMVQRSISRYKERQQARQQRQSGMVGGSPSGPATTPPTPTLVQASGPASGPPAGPISDTTTMPTAAATTATPTSAPIDSTVKTS